jgi:hypothetical protein
MTVLLGHVVATAQLTEPSPAFTPDPPVRLMFEISTIKGAGDFLSAYLDRPVMIVRASTASSTSHSSSK